jgi:hypothetical protein
MMNKFLNKNKIQNVQALDRRKYSQTDGIQMSLFLFLDAGNIYIIIIIIIIYFNCKCVFTRWKWYYDKTQHANNTHHTK